MALEELTDAAPAAAEPDRLFAKVGDAGLHRLGIDDQVLAAARTITDEAALHALAPLLPESQADVLQALAAGYDVEQVWADVVAPRIPTETVDTDASPRPSSAPRAGSRSSTGPTSCSRCSPSRSPCGGYSCTRRKRRSPTVPRTGAALRYASRRFYVKRTGCPVDSSTAIHRSPRGSTWLRRLTASAIGRCTNRRRQRPTTISVRPDIAACTAACDNRTQ